MLHSKIIFLQNNFELVVFVKYKMTNTLNVLEID